MLDGGPLAAVCVPLGGALSLAIGERPHGDSDYPTARMQTGLLLLDGDQSLAEEGVGFGVPVLKQGVRTIFPARRKVTCRRDGATWVVTATYEMDLVERLAKRGGRGEGGNRDRLADGPGGDGPGSDLVQSRALYAVKDSLAALHRRSPRLRRPLAATSAAVRRAFGWMTTYEETASCGVVTVTHVAHADGDAAETRVAVTVDLSGLTAAGITEVVVMNEQGARCFDRYEDASGAVLRGADIGTWDEIGAARASLVSTSHRAGFTLAQVPGARLYRGRELVGSRLAWAGFGYSLPPARGAFDYDLTIASTP